LLFLNTSFVALRVALDILSQGRYCRKLLRTVVIVNSPIRYGLRNYVSYLVLVVPVDKIALRVYVHWHGNADVCVLYTQHKWVHFTLKFIRSLVLSFIHSSIHSFIQYFQLRSFANAYFC